MLINVYQNAPTVTLEITRIKSVRNVISNAKHVMDKTPINAIPVLMDFITSKN